MNAFDRLCALRPDAGPRADPDAPAFVGEATADWGQGRALFGGAVAAMAVGGMAALLPADRPLRSLVCDFVGPVEPGPVRIVPRVLRAGRAVTQASAEVRQGEQVCAVVVAAFGASRPSPIAVPGVPVPAAPLFGEVPTFPYLDGITPRFTQHFAYRMRPDGVPFTGGSDPRLGGWVRFAEPAPVGVAGVLALLDAWPAPVLPLFTRPAPASTVTWMVNLVAEAPEAGWPGAMWWRFEAETEAAGGGYCDVTGRLWDDAGRLVATSRQLVVEFA